MDKTAGLKCHIFWYNFLKYENNHFDNIIKLRFVFNLGLESKMGEKTGNLFIHCKFTGYSTADEMVKCHIASCQCSIALM